MNKKVSIQQTPEGIRVIANGESKTYTKLCTARLTLPGNLRAGNSIALLRASKNTIDLFLGDDDVLHNFIDEQVAVEDSHTVGVGYLVINTEIEVLATEPVV